MDHVRNLVREHYAAFHLNVGGVSCPEGIQPARPGHEFDCVAVLRDGAGSATTHIVVNEGGSIDLHHEHVDLPTSFVAKEVTTWFKNGAIEIDEVTCPSLNTKDGSKVECDCELSGVSVEVQISVRKGQTFIQSVQPVYPAAAAADLVAKHDQLAGRVEEVSCPPMVGARGTTWDCEASVEGVATVATVKWTDDVGNFEVLLPDGDDPEGAPEAAG